MLAVHRTDAAAAWRQLGECRGATGDDLFVGAKVWSKVNGDGLTADIVALHVRGQPSPVQQLLLGPRPDPNG